MSEPSTSAPKMDNRLSTLNDHCLLQIMQHLSVSDLANVRDSNKSIAPIVDMEFSKQTGGSLCFGFGVKENIIQVLRQFGPLVNELSIDYKKLRGKKWSDIFAAIKENYDGKLKKLTLAGRTIAFLKQADILLIENILKNVETLELENQSDAEHRYPKKYLHILSHCENVQTLTLTSIIDIKRNPTLFQNNRNLLKMKWCGPKDDGDLKMIVDNLMNTRLEEFTVSFMQMIHPIGNFSEFLRLRHLKRLSIDCKFVDISAFLSNINAVDNALNLLCLSYARLDHTNIATLVQSTRLKVLKLLDDCVLATNSPISSLLGLCCNKNFEHLLILSERIGKIGKDDFLKIIAARKLSGSGSCLHLTLNNDVFKASLQAIPSELLEANKEILKLVDEYDYDYEYNNLDDF